jgi:hypothetical protein
MIFEKTIFAIDGGHKLRNVKKFTKFLDQLVAMDRISQPALCIGNWGGIMENSYMMDSRDFNAFIRGRSFVAEQECVMLVPGDVRQPCTLDYLHSPTKEAMNPMREVSALQALSENIGWTYVLATGKYFTTMEQE